jgi:putative transposase
MTKQAYPSDLTDAQWHALAPLIPPARSGGRPRTVSIRAVVNAIFYRTRTGCQWRQLPRDFPPWSTVAGYYRSWRRTGVWQSVHDALREQVRIAAGRDPTPSAAIIDSQSVKTTETGGRAASTAGRRSRGASGTFW